MRQKQKMAAAEIPTKRDFYAAIIEVLEGIITYSRNLADAAEMLAPMQTISEKKRRLLEMAERYRRVPEHPATGFKDALTTIWLCWIALNLENPNVGFSLGRLDQVLNPLYRQDVDNGKLHPADALELLCFFWLKIGDHVPMMPEAAETAFWRNRSKPGYYRRGCRQPRKRFCKRCHIPHSKSHGIDEASRSESEREIFSGNKFKRLFAQTL